MVNWVNRGKPGKPGKLGKLGTHDANNKDDADIRAADTASIDCASLVGGANYDAQNPWVCPLGELLCPYNHVLASGD